MRPVRTWSLCRFSAVLLPSKIPIQQIEMCKGLRTPGNDSVVTIFGLAINEREQKTCSVVSARCLFCETLLCLEAEDQTARKLKRKMNVDTFKRPFRSEKFKSQLNGKHWKSYI